MFRVGLGEHSAVRVHTKIRHRGEEEAGCEEGQG